MFSPTLSVPSRRSHEQGPEDTECPNTPPAFATVAVTLPNEFGHGGTWGQENIGGDQASNLTDLHDSSIAADLDTVDEIGWESDEDEAGQDVMKQHSKPTILNAGIKRQISDREEHLEINSSVDIKRHRS